MAAPTLTLLNHTVISTAESITNWTLFNTLDPDIKKEGSNSISGILRANGANGYYTATTAPVSAAGKTIRGWVNTTNMAYMQTVAGGGYQLLCWDGTNTAYKTLFGSDTYFGGWYYICWSMDDFTTLTLANVRRWGIFANHATSAKNVINAWIDGLRYLDGYSMTGGTSGDKVRLPDIELADRGTSTLYGYGVTSVQSGVYFCNGKLQFGTGATTHYFEMDGQVLVFEDHTVATGLYAISGVGSGTNVVIKNSVLRSAGTTDATRFTMDWSEANLAALQFTDNLVSRASTTVFKSGQTATGNTFDNCGIITAGGADLQRSVIKNYAGAADTSPLVWNVNTNPSGYLDGLTVTKGTNAHHAIEFGTSSPTTLDLVGMTFTGFNASNNQNDSALHIKRTTGTVTINISGGAAPSYKSAGATVTIVATIPVTLTGLVNPTEVRVYTRDGNGDSDTEIAGQESVTGGSFQFSYTAGVHVNVVIFSVSYLPVTLMDYVIPSAAASIPISQIFDRQYENP